MKSSPSEVTELAFRGFVRASGLFRNRMIPYFARFGISGAQWGILRQLYREEREGISGLRLGDLGRRLLVRPPSVTGLVERLVRMGLVARKTASADQRAKHVSLTASGRKLVARVLKQHPSQMQSIMACFSIDEQRDFHHLMVKFATHLESLENGQAGNLDHPQFEALEAR